MEEQTKEIAKSFLSSFMRICQREPGNTLS